jgi:hypothetical protein
MNVREKKSGEVRPLEEEERVEKTSLEMEERVKKAVTSARDERVENVPFDGAGEVSRFRRWTGT